MRRLAPATALVLMVACSASDVGELAEVETTSATKGSIRLIVRDWSGVLGYQLLALVLDERGSGGAFWTQIKDDPFTGVDVVHPMYRGDDFDEEPHPDGWGAGDYIWDKTAMFEPGTYSVIFYANPGGLAPYGSHIPAEPIERRCEIPVEVFAGQVSTVEISEVPVSGPCPRGP